MMWWHRVLRTDQTIDAPSPRLLKGGSLVFALRVLLGILLSSLLQSASFAAELRVCLLENNLPYSSRQDNKGFDLDTAQAVAQVLDHSFVPVWIKNDTHVTEIEESDFPLRRLSRGGCEAIFSVPGREALQGAPNVTVGLPYYGAAFELVGPDGRTPTNFDALAETPVAVQAQTIANFALSVRKIPTRTVFSLEAALDAVAKKEAGAALLWGPTVGWYLLAHSDTQLTFADGYEPPTVIRWNEHVATREGDSVLRDAIDGALTQLRASGTLQMLLTQYGIPVRRPFEMTYSFAEMEKLRRQALRKRQ